MKNFMSKAKDAANAKITEARDAVSSVNVSNITSAVSGAGVGAAVSEFMSSKRESQAVLLLESKGYYWDDQLEAWQFGAESGEDEQETESDDDLDLDLDLELELEEE